MAFSSVLGASSVIKPGVCTSTTRPSVPYDGQLIYETDTDLVKAFNGTAFVTVGPSALTTATATVATDQSTSSQTYTDLATVGPAVTLTTGTKVLVFTSAQIVPASTRFGFISFATSGATTIAASDTIGTFLSTDAGGLNCRVGIASLMTVTAGSNTFTMKYKCNTGSSIFADRTIFVVAL